MAEVIEPEVLKLVAATPAQYLSSTRGANLRA